MTLLDRFRTQPQRHADPAARLAYVGEIPLTERDVIAAIAREDEDARVRKAAVAKLMDPGALGAMSRDDRDESVRAEAVSMLRDIALEAFEGVGENDSLEAVDALTDLRSLAQIAKTAGREIVALRALSRISDAHSLGSIARHAASEAARRGAFERLPADHAEILAVALNSEYKDTALAAVDLVTDRETLEQIAARGKNKSAAKRARAIVREAEERERGATAARASSGRRRRRAAGGRRHRKRLSRRRGRRRGSVSRRPMPSAPRPEAERARAEAAAARAEQQRRAAEEAAERERLQAAADEEAQRILTERRHVRLAELVEAAATVASDADLAAARKNLVVIRREWKDLVTGIVVDETLASRFSEIEAQLTAREVQAREADARARREALVRLQQLVGRVEPLAARSDMSLKAADRALRDVRTALASMPPLPTKQDFDEVTRRLKAAQTDADRRRRRSSVRPTTGSAGRTSASRNSSARRWKRSPTIEDPEAIAQEVRSLQQQWKQAADVPRAQADALWRRFKAAHDLAWARCEAHFAAQAEERAANLARKTVLCEQAEALAESTRWIETAEAIKKLQAEWKTIGPVSRGREKAIWDRFRTACDRFFTRRHEDLDRLKKVWAENLARKEALCAKAESLAESTDWEQTAAEFRKLQAEWKTIGPVKKSRSESIWQRFRGACDRFFMRHAQRHDITRAERVAAREAICAELEALSAAADAAGEAASVAPADLLQTVRVLRGRWQQEIAARGVDPDRARALDERFAVAFAARHGPLAGRLLGQRSRPGRQPEADGIDRSPHRRSGGIARRPGRGCGRRGVDAGDAPGDHVEGSPGREHDRRESRRRQPLARGGGRGPSGPGQPVAHRPCARADATRARRSLPAREPAHHGSAPERERARHQSLVGRAGRAGRAGRSAARSTLPDCSGSQRIFSSSTSNTSMPKGGCWPL